MTKYTHTCNDPLVEQLLNSWTLFSHVVALIALIVLMCRKTAYKQTKPVHDDQQLTVASYLADENNDGRRVSSLLETTNRGRLASTLADD